MVKSLAQRLLFGESWFAYTHFLRLHESVDSELVVNLESPTIKLVVWVNQIPVVVGKYFVKLK
jgi:hypothetical protein